MATKLTDRQKEIHDLLEKGKTPGEIAKKLKISENGVYQHMRRIRAATGAKPKRAASRSRAGSNSRSRSRTSAKRTTTKRSAPARRPAPVTPVPTTPLAAIRARRDEITATLDEVRAAEKRLSDELAKASAARERAEGSVSEELTRLAQSEAILTGKAVPKPPAKRSGAKVSGSKASANGKAAEAPAPEPTPAEVTAPEVEQEASDAIVNEPTPVAASVASERPGAETLPEFAQEDGFAGAEG